MLTNTQLKTLTKVALTPASLTALEITAETLFSPLIHQIKSPAEHRAQIADSAFTPTLTDEQWPVYREAEQENNAYADAQARAMFITGLLMGGVLASIRQTVADVAALSQ